MFWRKKKTTENSRVSEHDMMKVLGESTPVKDECDELIESLDALDRQHEMMLDRLHMLQQIETEDARLKAVELANLLRSQGVDTRE